MDKNKKIFFIVFYFFSYKNYKIFSVSILTVNDFINKDFLRYIIRLNSNIIEVTLSSIIIKWVSCFLLISLIVFQSRSMMRSNASFREAHHKFVKDETYSVLFFLNKKKVHISKR